MPISRTVKADLLRWSRFVLAGLVVGVAYGVAFVGTVTAILGGALTGTIISAIVAGLEVFGFDRVWAMPVRRMPFLAFFVLRTAGYLAAILFGVAIGPWLAETLILGRGEIAINGEALLYSISVSIVVNLAFAINQLLGQKVLWNFVAGRYLRPRVEERVLLFVDMASSTQIAERLGEVRFLDFLNRFVADVADAMLAERGEIHKYVGDEVIATWPLAAGIKDARCIRACFGALDRLAAEAAGYERDFGVSANLRAALHCGPVVRGELGTVKMEIALLGDTVNTTARIQQACRELGHPVLASAALIERIRVMPSDIASRPLGPVALRGKENAVELYALSAARSAA
jgi:adenylate cyclase